MKKNSRKPCLAVLMAHADDPELYCGGTMAKFAGKGYRVIFGVLGLCNTGFTKINGKKLYQSSKKVNPINEEEAKQAAKVLGAEFFGMPLMDHYFTDSQGNPVGLAFPQKNYQGESPPGGDVPLVMAANPRNGDEKALAPIDRVKKFLIENRPEIIIGQSVDRGIDHYAASLIVYHAWVKARKEVEGIGDLFIPVDKFSYIQKEPDWIEDVTGYEDIARKAIACHKIQDGESYFPEMNELWEEAGEKIGVKSGESFIKIKEIP